MKMGESEGATSIEYGVIASLIAVAILGAVYVLGDTLKWTLFIIAIAMTDDKPPPEIMAAIWPHVHGGDQEVDLQEYIDMRTRVGAGDHMEEDFGWADQNDDDVLDYDEWIEHKDGPEY
jgi:Flp pilus assembly pilin Flp